MRWLYIHLLTVFLLGASPLVGETIYLDKSSSEPYSLDVLDSTTEETVIRFRLHNFEHTTFSIEGREVAHVSIANTTLQSERGMPALPKFRKDIMLPLSSRPKMAITHFNSVKMNLGEIAPSKGPIYRNQNPQDIPYEFSHFYEGKQKSANYPQANAQLVGDFIFRQVRGVTFEINPMIYNATTRQTEVIREMIFTIQHNPTTQAQVRSHRGPGIHLFNKMYQSHFLNSDNFLIDILPIEGEPGIGQTGDLLIIADDRFVKTLDRFVEWKKKMGYPTKVTPISKIGRNYTQIKKHIQSEYDAQKSLAYVILVGDAEFVPFHPGTSGNARGKEADPMYALVEGKDSYPDLIVARFSVKTTTELDNIINRSINYESLKGDEEWLTKAIGIASEEGAPPDYERANLLRDELLATHFTVVDEHYEPSVRAEDISRSLNEGRSYINYIGHGTETGWATGWFQNSHISRLTNTNMLPMIISVACVNGHFNYRYGDSFAEAWLKSGTPTAPRGAITIFASSTNQSWVPPTVGQLKIAKMVAYENIHTMGGLMFNGSIAVLEDGDPTAVQTFQTWHIFGDPTLRLRTQPARKVNLTLPPSNYVNPAWLENMILETSDLHVSVMKDGELLASGISDENGHVVFHNLDQGKLQGTVEVTVSGANYVPETTELTFQ